MTHTYLQNITICIHEISQWPLFTGGAKCQYIVKYRIILLDTEIFYKILIDSIIIKYWKMWQYATKSKNAPNSII